MIEVQAMLGAEYNDCPVAFTVDRAEVTDEALLGDETRVKQILINLLNNAFKFTRRGCVSVNARTIESDRDGYLCLKVTIEDTGIGIEPDRLEHIFEPFSQADLGISREFGGSGLGLAICKRLCKAMYGDVWV